MMNIVMLLNLNDSDDVHDHNVLIAFVYRLIIGKKFDKIHDKIFLIVDIIVDEIEHLVR